MRCRPGNASLGDPSHEGTIIGCKVLLLVSISVTPLSEMQRKPVVENVSIEDRSHGLKIPTLIGLLLVSNACGH